MKTVSSIQKHAGIFAIITSIISIALVALWMSGQDVSRGYLGGLNWKEKIFNWHPIFMSTAFVCLLCSAVLSFRLFPFKREWNKLAHASLHLSAVIFFSLGLYAVFTGNNNPDYNDNHAYYPNLASLHSWLGISTISIYSLNFILGVFFFLLQIVPQKLKKIYLREHIAIGIIIIVMGGMSAVTGIMELITEVSPCGYPLDHPDTNPSIHYHLLSTGCKLANGAGISILITVIFTLYALLDIHKHSGAIHEDRDVTSRPLITSYNDA